MPHLMKKSRPYLSEDAVISILLQHGEWRQYNTRQKNSTRRRDLVEYRGMYFFILYHFTKMSLADIGKLFINKKDKPKDHATVLHGYKNFADVYLKYNKGNLSVTYDTVMSHINNTLQMKGFTPHLTDNKMNKQEAMFYIQHQRKIMFSLVKKQAKLIKRIQFLEKTGV